MRTLFDLTTMHDKAENYWVAVFFKTDTLISHKLSQKKKTTLIYKRYLFFLIDQKRKSKALTLFPFFSESDDGDFNKNKEK